MPLLATYLGLSIFTLDESSVSNLRSKSDHVNQSLHQKQDPIPSLGEPFHA